MKIDRNTESVARGQYARIAVCLDLTKPLVSKLIIEGKLQMVEYEGIRNICYHCGRYGHSKEDCLERKEKERLKESLVEFISKDGSVYDKEVSMEVPSKYGPWMVVNRRNNKGKNNGNNSRP